MQWGFLNERTDSTGSNGYVYLGIQHRAGRFVGHISQTDTASEHRGDDVTHARVRAHRGRDTMTTSWNGPLLLDYKRYQLPDGPSACTRSSTDFR